VTKSRSNLSLSRYNNHYVKDCFATPLLSQWLFSLISHYERSEVIRHNETTTFIITRKLSSSRSSSNEMYREHRFIHCGFLDTNFRFAQVLLENRSNWSSSSEVYREDLLIDKNKIYSFWLLISKNNKLRPLIKLRFLNGFRNEKSNRNFFEWYTFLSIWLVSY
jgi:hypothetical protein